MFAILSSLVVTVYSRTPMPITICDEIIEEIYLAADYGIIDYSEAHDLSHRIDKKCRY